MQALLKMVSGMLPDGKKAKKKAKAAKAAKNGVKAPKESAKDSTKAAKIAKAAADAAKSTKVKFVPPPQDGKVRLNLGCGDKPLEGYVNVDVVESRGGNKPDVQSDLRQLSFPDNHADEILSTHVIEHFYEWEVQDLLKEWMRVLKPGGKIVLECPNILHACAMILEDESRLLDSETKDGWMQTMYPLYGNPFERDPFMCHRWGWTPATLCAELAKAGYVNPASEPAQFKKGSPRDMRAVAFKPAK